MLEMFFKKKGVLPIMIFFTVIIILAIVITIVNRNNMVRPSNFNFTLFIGFVLFYFVFIPFSIIKNSKKAFATNRRVQEAITYDISIDKLKINGESFNAEHEWNKTYKIQETKRGFLIYDVPRMFNYIPKSNLSPDEIISLRQILKSIKSTNTIIDVK